MSLFSMLHLKMWHLFSEYQKNNKICEILNQGVTTPDIRVNSLLVAAQGYIRNLSRCIYGSGIYGKPFYKNKEV